MLKSAAVIALVFATGVAGWFGVKRFRQAAPARSVRITYIMKSYSPDTEAFLSDTYSVTEIDAAGNRSLSSLGPGGASDRTVVSAEGGAFVVDDKKKRFAQLEQPNGQPAGPAQVVTEEQMARETNNRKAEILGRTVYIYQTENEGKPLLDVYVSPEFGAGVPLKQVRYADEGRVAYVKEAVRIEPLDTHSIIPGPDYRLMPAPTSPK